MEKRNAKIDCLKGIAIFLVVYGHSIQYCSNDNVDFFMNPVFSFVYSFHMPLFMFISGYLFYNSLNKDTKYKYIIYKRFNSLIIPAISWYTLYTICVDSVKIFLNEFNFKIEFKHYLIGIPHQFWFLYTLFYLICLVIIGKSILGDNKYYYIILFLIILLLPDMFNLQYLKFMYPYFVGGYFSKKYRKIIYENRNMIIIIASIVFFIMILDWKKDYYIYTTGMNLFTNNIINKFKIILYRYIIGIAGSILMIYLGIKLYYIDRYNILSKLGKYTLSIYIIQSYIFMFIDKINFNINNNFIFNIIFTPSIAIIVITICLIINRLLSKNIIIRRIFLGR